MHDEIIEYMLLPYYYFYWVWGNILRSCLSIVTAVQAGALDQIQFF